MSSQEEQSMNEEEDEEQENEEESEEQEDEEEEDEQEDEDEQDEDDDEEEDDQENSGGGQEQQDSESKQSYIPTFKQPQMTEQFKFQSLLSEISSLGTTVNNLINTFPSRGGSQYRTYQPKPSYQIPRPLVQPDPSPPKYMKDEDIQVSMQPQIVIQKTLTPTQEPKKQPYKISNESTKFLAQLYEQNKKLKRWQRNQLTHSDGLSRQRNKFERKDYETGVINIDDRNRQIDEAIQMLRREDYESDL